MNRRNIFSLSAITALGLALPVAAHAQTAKQLAGTWQLVSEVNTAADGTKKDPSGTNPNAMLIFTADGDFMLINLRRDLPKFASNNRA